MNKILQWKRIWNVDVLEKVNKVILLVVFLIFSQFFKATNSHKIDESDVFSDA